MSPLGKFVGPFTRPKTTSDGATAVYYTRHAVRSRYVEIDRSDTPLSPTIPSVANRAVTKGWLRVVRLHAAVGCIVT